MAVDRSTLRLVATPPSGGAAGAGSALETALRLTGSDCGALVRHASSTSPEQVLTSNLSPEEEAACIMAVRRLWQRPQVQAASLSRLGGSTLITQPLEIEPVPDGNGPAEYVLVAIVRGGAGRVDTERLATIRDVAALLASAMHGASAAERASAAVAEMRLQDAQNAALNRSVQALVEAGNIEEALGNVLLELMQRFSGVDLATCWLVEHDSSRVRRLAAVGLPEDDRTEEYLPLRTGLAIDTVVESGVALELDFTNSRRRSASAKRARKLKLATVLEMPLRSRGQVTGVLILGSKSLRTFTEEERTSILAVGALIGGQFDGLRELEAARAQGQRLRTLIETLPMGIVLYEPDGRVSLWNSATVALFGAPPADMDIARRSGLPALRTFEGRLLQPEESPILRAAQDGISTMAEEMVVHGPSSEYDTPVMVTAAPIADPHSQQNGVIAVYQDITRLREIDRLKDDFINTVSHELRTPTTTVRGGALTMLKRGEQLDSSTRRQLLQDMADEAERLYHLVEDLLSLSRAQAGMRLQPEPLILSRFVNKVILDLGGRVGNHALTVDVPNDLPLVEADPTNLEQVLRNLLENAVKFSPKGRRIEITAEAKDQSVLFSVLDRGSGIPAEDMDRVFEPFYRNAEAIRTGQQGAGLGLAVSRRLIEVQGGRIWAERRPGGGTAFRFTLPALSEEDSQE